MKLLVAAVALALLTLRLVLLLPAEAADRPVAPGSAAWRMDSISGGQAISTAAPMQAASIVSSSAQAQVVVSARILPVRLLVLDDAGNLAEVWSNVDGPARLVARLTSRSGPEAPLTDALRAAYDRVAPTILPGARGLVYQRP